MLRALPAPGVGDATSYEAAAALCGGDPRWGALAEERRRAGLEAYQAGLVRAEAQARQQVRARWRGVPAAGPVLLLPLLHHACTPAALAALLQRVRPPHACRRANWS
jgi:hypothetical protein